MTVPVELNKSFQFHSMELTPNSDAEESGPLAQTDQYATVNALGAKAECSR